MKRKIYSKLNDWKQSTDRKPLIINGARQVGKTYIIKQFGDKEYAKQAYFSLDREIVTREVFKKSTNIDTILHGLSAISGVDITPSDTIIFLDEIQECPEALTALKFFCEDANDYHIIVAGSLLGISLHGETSFPVGKVDMMRMYPMDFEEFLMANGKDKLAAILQKGEISMISTLSTTFEELLRQYYYVGGMPAAVKTFVEKRGLSEVRQIQKQILFDYQRDFSKHTPASLVPRINMVWNSIPSQLARENKKFLYGAMKKGGRASEFELAIQWLIDAGLVYKVNRVKKPYSPLKFYEDFSAFKLFTHDIGLMGAMVEADPAVILVNNTIFSEYKGAFTELYIHNELISRGYTLFYHSVDNSSIEIDFLTQKGAVVFPIEVKAEENVKAKSLKTFVTANPGLKGLRFSMKDFIDQEWMTNIPLYAVSLIDNLNQ